MMRRSSTLLAGVAALTLSLGACAGGGASTGGSATTGGPTTSATGTPSDGGGSGGGEVVVGSAGFTESQLLAEMYALLLDDAGYDARVQTVQNRELYEPALETGEIDVVPDYLATMAEFLNVKVNGEAAETIATADAEQTAEALRGIAEPLGLTVLSPAEAKNSNAFAVSRSFAEEHDLQTLSDLGEAGIAVRLAATEECPTRTFCQIALEEDYGIEISGLDPLGFSSTQTKQAVRTGKAQLGLVGTTDGTLDAFDLVILADDKNVQLADNLVPVVGPDYADDETLASVLDELAAALTTEDLAALNAAVDQERRKVGDVAREWLEEQGLL